MRELRITALGVEYVYASDPTADGVDGGLLDTTVSPGAELGERGLLMGDVTLTVTMPLLGSDTRWSIPEPPTGVRGFRAVLVEDGVEVASGHVAPEDIEVDQPADTAAVTLVSGAEEQLWAALDGLSSEMPVTYSAGDRLFLPVVSQTESGGEFAFPVVGATSDGYSVAFALRSLLVRAGAPSAGSLVLPEHGFDTWYLDTGGVPRSVRRERSLYLTTLRPEPFVAPDPAFSTGLPWSGRQTVEAILNLLGWRLDVRYAAYPSSDLVVDVLDDRWRAPSPELLPDLDGRVGVSGWTAYAETAAVRDAGLRHATPLRSTGPEVPPFATLVPAPPPPSALVAGERWAFQTTRDTDAEDPRPDLASLVETSLSLPLVVPTAYAGSAVDGHPNFSETIHAGPLARPYGDDSGAVYLVESVEVGGAFQAVWARVTSGAAVPGRSAVTGAAHASTLIDLREVSRSPLWAIDGGFYVHGIAYAVGDESQGLAFDGEAWRVTSSETNLDDDAATLTLVRPRAAPDPVAMTVVGPVVGLTWSRPTVGGTGYLVVTWRPPIAALAGHYIYRVETRTPPSPTWTVAALAYAPRYAQVLASGSHLEVRVVALGYDRDTGAVVESPPQTITTT